jgi:hypothetical protein
MDSEQVELRVKPIRKPVVASGAIVIPEGNRALADNNAGPVVSGFTENAQELVSVQRRRVS